MKKLLQTMSLAALYALGIHAEDAASVMMNDDAVQVVSNDSMDGSSSSDFAALLSSAMPDAPESMGNVLSDAGSDDAAPAVVQAPQSSALKVALDARAAAQSSIEAITLQFFQNNNIPLEMLQQLMAARSAVQQAYEAVFIEALTANEVAIQSETLDEATRLMMQQFQALLGQRIVAQQQVEAAIIGALAPQDTNLPEADGADFRGSEDDSDEIADAGDDSAEDDSDEVIAQSYTSEAALNQAFAAQTTATQQSSGMHYS